MADEMNLSKTHHIAIVVSDYDATKEFYVNNFITAKVGVDVLCVSITDKYGFLNPSIYL